VRLKSPRTPFALRPSFGVVNDALPGQFVEDAHDAGVGVLEAAASGCGVPVATATVRDTPSTGHVGSPPCFDQPSGRGAPVGASERIEPIDRRVGFDGEVDVEWQIGVIAA
jgi:hypothetical protein